MDKTIIQLEQLCKELLALDTVLACVYKARSSKLTQQLRHALKNSCKLVDKKTTKCVQYGLQWLEKAEPQLWANIQQNPSTVFEAATTVMALITEVGECIDRSAMLMAAFDALLIPMAGVNNPLLSAIMSLLTGLTRLALLCDTPPLLLSQIHHMCHVRIQHCQAGSEAGSAPASRQPSDLHITSLAPPPVLHTLFTHESVVSYLQTAMQAARLTSHFTQVVDLFTPVLAVASCPVVLSTSPIFTPITPPPASPSQPQPHTTATQADHGTPGTDDTVAAEDSAAPRQPHTQLPPQPHPSRTTGTPTTTTPHQATPVHNSTGLPGLTLDHSLEVVGQLGELRAWAVACAVACPHSVSGPAGQHLLELLSRGDVRMEVYRERCVWLPLILAQHVVPFAQGSGSAGGAAAGPKGSSGGGAGVETAGVGACVVSGVQHAMQHAAGEHRVLRSYLVHHILGLVAACQPVVQRALHFQTAAAQHVSAAPPLQADARCLPANIALMRCLLSLARYEVLWAARHHPERDGIPWEVQQMCGRGSGITAAATKGLLGSADVADTTVLELVAAMEELGAVLEEQHGVVMAEMRACAVAALQSHLLPGIEALSGATLAHPGHAPAIPPLRGLVKGLETILATDTPHDAPAQLARLRRLWLPLLALLHEKPAAPPRQTATGVQGPTEEQSGGDISSRHVPLRPFHLDAYAQSSQFTSSIQFVMQAATLLHEPPGLHAAVGSLHALPAFHAHVLVQLVGKSLLRPHTAHCAVVGLKVLHWLPRAADAVCSQAVWEHAAWALAHDIMTKLCAALKAGITPLTLVYPDTDPGAVMQQVRGLAVAMNDAEAVRVVGSKGVVPREYLRQVVVQGLHTLLHNLAHAAAAAGTGAAVLGGAPPLSPTTVHGSVRRYLRFAAMLQPLLSIDLQPNLIHVLMGAADTAPLTLEVDKGGQAAGQVHQDSNMGAHMRRTMGSTGGGDPCDGNGGSSGGAGVAGGLQGPQFALQCVGCVDGGTMVHPGRVLLEWLACWYYERAVMGKGGPTFYDPDRVAFMTTADLTSAAGSNATTSSSTVGGGGSSGGTVRQLHQAVFSEGDMVCLLEVFGPHTATVMTKLADAQAGQCIKAIDSALRVRHRELLAVDSVTAKHGPTVGGAHIRTLLTQRSGPYSACELSAVGLSVRLLGRCLGLRRLVGEAVRKVGGTWAPAWTEGMETMAIPRACDVWRLGAAAAAGGTNSRAVCVGSAEGSRVAGVEGQGAGIDGLGAVGPSGGSRRCLSDLWDLPQPVCNTTADPLLASLLQGHVREREAWEAWSLLPALVVLAAAAAPTWLAAETASTQLGPCGPLVHHSVMALVCEEVHKALHAAGAQVLGVPTGPQVLRGRDSRAMLQGMLAAAAHCHGRAGSDGGATSVGRAVTHVQAEPGGSCAVQAQAGAPRWSDMMGWAAGFGRSS